MGTEGDFPELPRIVIMIDEHKYMHEHSYYFIRSLCIIKKTNCGVKKDLS